MSTRTPAALAVAVAVVAATAPAVVAESSGQSARILRYRVAGSAWDLGASASCPDGSVRYDVVGVRGRRIGTATTCVVEATKRDGVAGIVVVTERVVETDAFADGWLRWRSFQEHRTSGDGERATISIHGDVTGGTRRFARARGAVSGVGTRRGEHLDVRITVSLR